jgi:alkaline phosphatase
MPNSLSQKHYRPVILVVIDGFGLGEERMATLFQKPKNPLSTNSTAAILAWRSKLPEFPSACLGENRETPKSAI